MNTIIHMKHAMGRREAILEAQTKRPLDILIQLQMKLDVAHFKIREGLKYDYPGMVEHGSARVEEIQAQVWEIVRNP